MKKLLYFALNILFVSTSMVNASQPRTEGGGWGDLLTELAGTLISDKNSGSSKTTTTQNLGTQELVSKITQLSDKALNIVGSIESLRNIDPETKGAITKALLSFIPELNDIKNQILGLTPSIKNTNASESSLVDLIGKAAGTLFGNQDTATSSQGYKQNEVNQNQQQEGNFLGKILQQLGDLSK